MSRRAWAFLSAMGWAASALASIVVHDAPGEGRVALVADGHAATIVVDPEDHRVVTLAAACLAEDVERVAGRKPGVAVAAPARGPALIVGSIDRSPTVRALVEAGKLDVADLRGQWESFKTARVDDALVIVGSDRRGTAYGALELSRAIGVSPWYWWADVPPKRRQSIYISADGARIGPPSVKYRGIFLNDEDWGLQPWAAKTFEPDAGDIGPKTYARIFELLLRLKANYCWPAMHDSTRPFNAFPQNKQVADDYAIVMGSSHAEPMLRNNVGEWPADQKDKWDPVANLPGILEYWESRVRENGKFENVYTVGMRGIHDSGMPGGGTIDEKRDRLEKVIGLQRDMLARHVNPDPSRVPQIFCPYKEVLDIYQSRMKLPDDVTIVWPDDNHGFIRQLSNAEERRRGGSSGVYYHLSYWGRPHDYLWLESLSPALVWYEMSKAFDFGSDRLWVANVGDVKPAEAGMTLFLEMGWDARRYGPDVFQRFLDDFYTEQFGPEHGPAIGDVKREYFRLCAIRKPEHLGWSTVYPNTPVRDSDLSHDPRNDEAMRLVERWLDVSRRADAIAEQLAGGQRPAFFQLVQYPAAAGAAMAEKLILAERSRLLAARGDAAASGFADRAEAAMGRIKTLTRQYNEQLGGKWRHMMDHRPRKLPVFGPPIVPRVDGRSPAPAMAPTTLPAARPLTITVDAARPTRLTDTSARWVVIDGLGRNGAALALFPRLASIPFRTPEEIRMNAPVAEYAIDVAGSGGAYEVVVDALPTHPITPQHQLVCGISFGDEPPRIVRFEQSGDERNRTWQQNVLRNAMTARTSLPLRPGKHVMRLWGVDPSVAVQGVTIAAPVD